jgi:signal transduction histidine kinase
MKHLKIHLGLRGRITLTISSILVITFSLIAVFLVRNAQNTDIANLNQSSKAFASLATEPIGSTFSIYQASGSLRIDQQIATLSNLDGNISNVGIINLSGDTVFTQNPSPPIQSVKMGSTFNPVYTTGSDRLVSQIVVPYIDNNGEHPYSIAYTVSSNGVRQDIDRQIRDIIIFSFIGLIVCAGSLYELTSLFFVGPIERVSREALIISRGKFEQTVDVSSHDEIGDLANSVNTMSQRLLADIAKLQEVDTLKNEFITITSHNLRTPLTIIKGNIELLDPAAMPPGTAKTLQSISDSAARLESFAEDMLTIASIEANNKALVLRDSTITDLVTKKLRDTFTAAAAAKGIILNWNINDPAAVVSVSASHIQGVIRNLLDNAVKFTEKGNQVDFTIGLQNSALVITVHDTGIGISADEQTKLFTKFHRATNIMQYDYAGTGIGLYVTKLIAEAQHGSVSVASEEGKGSTFTVTIPQLVNPASAPTQVSQDTQSDQHKPGI